MHPLAVELNQALAGAAAGSLLSDLGRRLYFPKGIVAQSAEAKKQAKRMNATVGIACRDGRPMFLGSIRDLLDKLEPEEIFPYAPTQGVEQLRQLWKQELALKNPDLAGKSFSTPVVVPGLTAGIATLADLFVDRGDPVVLPDLHWDNYPLIFETRREARIVTFPLYTTRGGFNTQAMASALRGAGTKAILLLNFPNNPSGYSPTKEEAAAIISAIRKTAEAGATLLAITDDAYFGLFYEEETEKQSLFARLCDLHENVLAAKVDGSTKEDLTWGFRTGFLTLGARGMSEAQHEALVRKLMGAVRSSVSNSSVLAQSLILRGVKSPTYGEEKRAAFETLRERYRRSRAVLASRQSDVIEPLPFNSGYFMSFRLRRGKAEELRQALLREEAIGTIAIDDRILRVAFSSVEASELESLFDIIYRTADRVLAGRGADGSQGDRS